MKARAAVAWEPQKPLVIEEVDVEGPKQGGGLAESGSDRCLPYRRLYPLRR